MEHIRLLLIGALCLLGFMLWTAWENDYSHSTPQPQKVVSNVPFQPAATAVTNPTVSAEKSAVPQTKSQRFINVTTDVLNVTIDTLGGNIVKVDLLKYPKELHSQQPFELLSNDPEKYYVAQSGLMSSSGPDTLQGQATYTADQTNYTLAPGQNDLTVDLKWKNNSGVEVTKQFMFHREDYQIKVNYLTKNNSTTPWIGQFYTQLERKKVTPPDHGFFAINPYMGGAISSPEKPYQKISFDKMSQQDLNLPITGGWAAMLEHYFLSAWVPASTDPYTYYTHVGDNSKYILGMLGKPFTVAPKEQATVGAKLYAGPEIMDVLKNVAPNLDLTIDYGILWFVSISIFWLMKHIYAVVGNWGWSIVLVTVLIKLAFYHLSAKSYRSMAAMRKLQPKLQALKERFGDDRQKLTQATMELYRNEKINPLSGCLPIIVQIPVFIALYWVLLESVELRQAPFILWIHDLSARDPYYILPIIMGITMFVQQKLNPPPPDPVQAKMMNFLPIFFTILFISFPAGLVLYWVVNNTLSILQQWYIMRSVDSVSKKKRINKAHQISES